MKRLITLFAVLAFFSGTLFGQYQTNGTAVLTGPDCYRLTQNLNTQAGSVWNLNQVDISQPFDLYFEVFLGCSNVGADGMAFVLQPISTNIGTTGGGLGYQGITPSLALEMDTYQNGGPPTNDPVFDHMALMSNGVIGHLTANNLVGPIAILPGNGNVEDCLWHDLRITWEPATFTLQVYFDCSLRITYTGNIVANIFGGNPNVFWGFTAATGGSTNEHRFCLNYVSFSQALRDTAICLLDTVPLNVGAGSTFVWTPSAGLSDTTISDPLAYPDTTTTYTATITDACGNQRVDSVTIKVATPAQLVFSLGNDTTLCQGDTLIFDYTRPCVDYTWQNGDSLPIHIVRSPGTYWLDLVNACGNSRDSVDINYELPPTVNLGNDTLVCNGAPFLLDGTFVSQTPFGTQYLWQDASTMPTLNAGNSGIYWVDVTTYCGTVRDSISVLFDNIPVPFSLGPDTLLCEGDTLVLDATQFSVDYLWQNASTDSTFTVVSPGGQYWVAAVTACGIERDTINVTYMPQPSADLGNDTTLCTGNVMIGICVVPNPALPWNIIWNTGAMGSTQIINGPGKYIACVSSFCLDVACDTICVDYLDPPSVDLGSDTILCPGTTLFLDITDTLATSYLWQDNSTQPTFTVTMPGTYTGTAANQCGSAQDSILVSFNGLPTVDLGPDQNLCAGEVLNLDASGIYNDRILWQDGATSATYAITSSGIYWVEVSNDCESFRDSILVIFDDPPPPFDLGTDPSLCQGDSIVFDISGPADLTYIWSDGSFEPTLTVFTAGTYWAETRNACGTRSDTVEVIFTELPYADLGSDLLLCSGNQVTLDVTQPGSTYQWQNGSTASTYNIFQSGTYWVRVTNSCGTIRDEVEVLYDKPPGNIDLGPDATVCISDSLLVLDATLSETSTAPMRYLWRLGETDPVFKPDHSARYWVTATNRCGSSSDTVVVVLELLPQPDLGPDTLKCPDEEIRLDGTVPGNPEYVWHNFSKRSYFFAKSEGSYKVTVTNTCGVGVDSVFLKEIDCSCTVYMPSAFTPNGDDVNDQFGPAYDCEISNVTLKVYSRWGNTVFETDNPDELWDGNKNGKPVAEGVYVWVLQYQGYKDKIRREETKTGTVTVLR